MFWFSFISRVKAPLHSRQECDMHRTPPHSDQTSSLFIT